MNALMKFAFFFLLCILSETRSETTNKRIIHGPPGFDAEGEDPGGRRHLTQADTLCPDGSPAASFRCGCAVLSAAEHSTVMSVSLNGAIRCTPICGDDDAGSCEEQTSGTQQEDCSQYVCVQNNCGVTELGASDIQIIRGGCEFDEDAGWMVCSGGFTVDQPTFGAVTGGVCAPACGQPQLSCQFPARHGPTIFLDPSPSPSLNITDEEPDTPEEDVDSNCRVGQEPDGYICSCSVVTPQEMQFIEQAFTDQGSCVPYCGDPSALTANCQRQCETDVCIGPRDNVQCAAFVERRISEAINTFDCTDNEATNTVECRSGSSYLEVDQPSFTTISNGVCVPGCGMSQAGTRCRFNPMIRRAFLNETTAEPSPAPEESPSSETSPDTAPASEPVPSDAAPSSEPASSEPAESSIEPQAPESAEASVEPPASEIEPDAPESAEASVEPPASEIEPDAPESAEASVEPPESELEIEPPESEIEFEPPGSEPEPDAPESEVEPPESELEPEAPDSYDVEEPLDSVEEPAGSVEGPEAMGSEVSFAPGSEEVDICATILRMRADTSFNEESDQELFDAMFELPEECLEPSAAPSAFDSAIAPDAEPSSAPESELEIEPDLEPEEMDAEPSISPLDEEIEEPFEEPDFPPELPPESAPAPAPELDEVTVPVQVGDTSNRVYATDWGECSQFCAQAATTATRERTVLCRNAFGLPLPANQCDPEDFDEFESSEDCELEDCDTDGSYFVIGDWSSCSLPCAEYNPETQELEAGVQTREVTCFTADDEEVPARQCRDLVPSNIDMRRQCNTNPCEIVVLEITEWSPCSCENSTQTRTVRCLSSSGEVVDLAQCEAQETRIPQTSQRCNRPRRCDRVSRKVLQIEQSESCAGLSCSNRGECNDGQCTCTEGFDGVDCQLDVREESSCPSPGILDPEGACCESGVFDLSYECCSGDADRVQLDIQGNCCEGRLDMCGVCNGSGVLDALGRCCTGTLDGNGLCCFSNNIDECGVCEGDGASCVTEIMATFQRSAQQIQRQCAAPFSDLIREALDLEESANVTLDSVAPIGSGVRNVAAFIVPSVRMDLSAIEEALVNRTLSFLDEEPRCSFTNLDINKEPVCGNGICEIGEAPSNSDPPSAFECEDDCTMDFMWCELTIGFRDQPVSCSGHGLCLYANNGQCDCFTGYIGPNCEDCAPGFYRLNESDTRCFPRQNIPRILGDLAPPPSEAPEIEPEPAEEEEDDDDGEGGALITGVDSPEAIDSPDPVDSPDPAVVDTRDFAAINPENTLESDDDDANLLAIVLPATVVPFVLFLFVAYHYASKRNRDSTRTQKDLFTKKKLENQGPPPGGPAKSESAMWKDFVSKLRPAARPTASRRRGLERLVNRSFQDSPSTSRSRLRAEDESPTRDFEYIREEAGLGGGHRGIPDYLLSPQSSVASPSQASPSVDRRRHGLVDVRKWDSKKLSIKGSSNMIVVEGSESGSEQEDPFGEPFGEPRPQPRTATELQDISTVDDGERDAQTGVASSMEIHGVPSETARTADTTQSVNSES